MSGAIDTLIRTSGVSNWPEPIKSGKLTPGDWALTVAPSRPFAGVIRVLKPNGTSFVIGHVNSFGAGEDETTANGLCMAASKRMMEAIDAALAELSGTMELTVGTVRKLRDAANLAHGRVNLYKGEK